MASLGLSCRVNFFKKGDILKIDDISFLYIQLCTFYFQGSQCRQQPYKMLDIKKVFKKAHDFNAENVSFPG